MANEADVVNLDSDIHYFTVADGTAIQKGTIMVISADPRTIIAHSAANEIFVGVAVEDKVAGDGQTRIGVRTRGIFDMVASAAITLGRPVALSGTANQIRDAGASLSLTDLNAVFGRCLETASASEKVNVIVGGAGL